MKTPSDDLFTLVKSLDTREKGFFKVFSYKRSSDKNELSYLKLFDAIDKLRIYDESLLLARLTKTGFKHHLKKAKSYLTKAIYDSLREYHSDASVHTELRRLIDLAEIFIAKGLTIHAKKILLQAEKLSEEYELYDYCVVIGSLKARVLGSIRNSKDMEDYLKQGVLKENQYIDRLKNVLEFRNLSFQLMLIARTHYKAREKAFNETNTLLKSPLVSSPGKALSFTALQHYYTIHILCSFLSNKFTQAAYKRQEECVTHLESDKAKLSNRAYIYVAALANLMLVQIRIGRTNESEKTHEKIKQFYFLLPPKKRTKDIFVAFLLATSNNMDEQLKSGNPEKALNTWEQIQHLVSFNNIAHNDLLLICDNISRMYIALNKYHDALKWTNTILGFKEKNMLDIQAMARVYLLLVHYELGNYDLLPYIAKSSQRFLMKHDFFGEFERIMINFFETKISKTSTAQEKTEAFFELKEQFGNLLKTTKPAPALEYFDYVSWIESKIENQPFSEVVKEKSYIVKSKSK